MPQRIKVEAELIDKVTDKSKTIGKSVTKDFGKIQSAGQGLSKSISGIAKGFAALYAIKKGLDFFGKAATAANVQSIANAKLAAALKATKGAAGLTYKELRTMAQELQKTTLFGDETTQMAQGIMLTFKSIGSEVFPKAISLAQDMSTVFGQDLRTSSLQLGKALEDPIRGITALGRAGVTFSKAERGVIKSLVESGDIMKAQGIILEALEGQVGGTAVAVAEAGLGPWESMKNTLGDVTEQIGAQLIPSMNRFAKYIIKISPIIQDVGSAVARFFSIVVDSVKGIFEATTVALLGIVGGAAKLFGWFVGLIKSGLEKLPDKFVPDSWIEGLGKAQLAIDAFADASLGGAIASGEELDKILQRIAKTATTVATLEDIVPQEVVKKKKKKPAGVPDPVAVKDAFAAIQSIHREFLQVNKTDREKAGLDLDSWYTDQAQALGNNYTAQEELYRVYLERRTEMRAGFMEEDRTAEEQHAQEIQGYFQEFSSGITTIAQSLTQTRLNNIDRERKAEVKAVQSSGKTSKEKQKLIAEINKKAEEEQRKMANVNKGIAIGEAIIGTAKGIANAIGMSPPPLGIAMAILIGAMGAAQIATIASQSFAHGGVVKGPRQGDQVGVAANGGEMFLTMQQQARLLAMAEGQAIGGGGNTTVHNEVSLTVTGDASDDVWADRVDQLKEALEELSFAGQST